MSGNSFGRIFQVTTFGESHGAALGVVIDGVPAGLPVPLAAIQQELDRRRPGQSGVTTARCEADQAEILSGTLNGVATGMPIAILIRNTDCRSGDYDAMQSLFRPGHADYAWFQKYGILDAAGGGRSSGRETAARVAAGAIAKLLLSHLGVTVRASAAEIGGVAAQRCDWSEVEKNPVRCGDPAAAGKMIAAIREAQAAHDSVGGIVRGEVRGVPSGWGEPVFDKLDALLGHALFSIGGVKGVEFGSGFEAAKRRGSTNNDPLPPVPDETGRASGGMLGGVSDGGLIEFRVAVKPTPTISQPQKTVDREGKSAVLTATGRHDPCLVPRIIPVVEAMTAIVLADLALQQRAGRLPFDSVPGDC